MSWNAFRDEFTSNLDVDKPLRFAALMAGAGFSF